MKTLTTPRLILRKFTAADFDAVHAYASRADNTTFMLWEPNSEEQTRAFIELAIAKADENPCVNFQYAAILKDSGKLIGACNIAASGDEAEIGWILHRDYWNLGLGSEMGKALLAFGFDDLKLRRICAHCDAENIGSYRVMEKIGMRREGVFIESRPNSKNPHKKYGDEPSYAILASEWETGKEIAYYNSLPCIFENFMELPVLSDDEIYLVCTAKKPPVPEKKYVPVYEFAVCKGGEKIGGIELRVGYKGYGLDEGSLYYGGQIGYGIDEKYRGNGYAARACKLLAPVAKAHSMPKLIITNEHTNTASRRVCEKLGARFIRVARIPEWMDLYKEGQRFLNIFEWSVELR